MPPRSDEFVLIGPTGWQLLGLIAIMGAIWWWLARKPGAPPPMIWVALQALWWRLFPALSTWHETNQEKARARFVKSSDRAPLSHMSSDDDWEDDDRPVAGVLQQNNNATTTDCKEESGNNALLLQHQAATLAKLIKAGVVGETKGLQIVFNVKPSSTSRAYQEARDALKAELEKLEPPIRHTPIANRPTREAFRSDGSGI